MFRKYFVSCLLLLLVLDLIVAQKPPQGRKQKGPLLPPPPTKKFLTLNGGPPEVVANGGYSGLFPDSSPFAYSFAAQTSLQNSIMYCNVQLTKDNLGLCASQILLDNSTTAAMAFPKGDKTYNLNGKDLHGWFSMDHTLDELRKTTFYIQNVLSRTLVFDGLLSISTPDDIAAINGTRMWLNVEYDMFFNDHKLSMAKYIQDSAQFWVPTHISSPEIGFLKFMSGQVDRMQTKLIFKFLSKHEIEPTIKEKYGAILDNLATVKPFVTGILVPKDYIVPITKDFYSDPPTTLVSDAHKLGLEVYAYGFANDKWTSYNYSYDPVNEYLQFIDNPLFSVDGLLTDFPSTASSSIACFAQSQNGPKKIVNGLVISHNGASGEYPGCTDLAYQKAIEDGVDVIDCTVQVSKDGVPFCLPSIDLSAPTTALATFTDRSTTVPELQSQDGIFSFDLDWNEIESLRPVIETPWKDSGLSRNPRFKNKGKFVTLADFLELGQKNKTGVLIKIENAAYLASKKGIGVVDTVKSALAKASFDKEPTQRVMIQSDDSSVLSAFNNVPTYTRILTIKQPISGAAKEVVAEIQKNANAVAVTKDSIVAQDSGFFTTTATKVVEDMHASNISVFIDPIRNEFVFLNFDFLSDPYVQLATYVSQQAADGVLTDFPLTASRYMRNPCADDKNLQIEFPIRPIQAGDLVKQIDPAAKPPALPPSPQLENKDVVDPPLPPVKKVEERQSPSPTGASPPQDKKSNSIRNVDELGLISVMVTLYISFGLLWH